MLKKNEGEKKKTKKINPTTKLNTKSTRTKNAFRMNTE